MECQLCGGRLEPWVDMPIDAKKDAATPFARTLRCAACGTGTLRPQPAADEVAALYDLPKYYTQTGSHIAEVRSNLLDRVLTKLAWWADRPKPFDVAEMARTLPPGAAILDLGCGDAALLARFAERGFDTTGVEPDPAGRAVAERRGVRVLPGTAEAPPAELDGRGFDLVVMTHSLEHTLRPALALANAARLVAPGGRLYVEVPNCGCVHFRTLTICSENFDSPRHLWFFEPAGLRQAIERAGFGDAAYRYEGFVRHHSRSWREWEKTIFDRVARHGGARAAVRHTFLRSLLILARSAFAPPERKYDCVGVLAVRRG